MMEETTTTTPPTTPVLKWDEDRERRRAYHKAYYQAHKAARPPPPPKEKKKCLVDWSNPAEVAALKKVYAQKEVKCEACDRSFQACSITHHNRSKYHLLAVARWLKGGDPGL